MLAFSYGHWEFWEDYDPSSGFYGPQKVTFDGVNKLILINVGETIIDIKTDIYGGWKEWLSIEDNAKYFKALTALGGDPITDSTNVGVTYFLENGWRVKPYLADYVLTMNGNIYTREPGQNPIVPTSGVTVSLTRSNLVDFVAPTLDDTVIDSVASDITNTVIPGIELATDHSRASNLNTQK